MDNYQKTEVVLKKMLADAERDGMPSATAYARMVGALQAWVTAEAADSLYNYYIVEAN